MTRNKLLRRLEALEEIVKPKVSEGIPPAAQAVIDRLMAAGKKAREEIEKRKAVPVEPTGKPVCGGGPINE